MDGQTAQGVRRAVAERIDGNAAAASRAREILTELFGATASPQALQDLHLLTTELVTNAVRHSRAGNGGAVELRVSVRRTALRVTVADPGSETSPAVQDLDVSTPGGMGLFLVEQISRRWGVSRDPAGATEVWFELPAA